MIPAAFDYTVPETLDQAIALLAKHGDDAKILTGGHSLIPMMKLRLAQPELVVDLRKIHSLVEIAVEGSELCIGAAATHAAIEQSARVRESCPLLVETAGQIGDLQVRNAGTIGGSVVHVDPAADWPAAMLAAGATMVLLGPDGERRLTAEDFFTGPLESAIGTAEILTAVRVPVVAQGGGASYQKQAQSASGFAIAGVAVQLSVEDTAIASVRVGITGVAATPYRPLEVEKGLTGSSTDEAAVRQACEPAAVGIEPLKDIHAGADYRANLARVLCRRATLAAISRARGATS